MTLLNIPADFIVSSREDKIEYAFGLTVLKDDDRVKFCICDKSTSWLNRDDRFVDRIQFGYLNPIFRKKHLLREIDVKNSLDEAAASLNDKRYAKAVEVLDEIIHYDPDYAEAILAKSKALFGQGHFVKSLRHYKKAIKINESLKDNAFHGLLIKKASQERDTFPKIKRNIYAGDEAFRKGEYESALQFYDKALVNSAKFKNKILSKLLNKKATALFKLKRYEDSLEFFNKSVEAKPNDKAYFHIGIIEYFLSMELSDEFKGPLRISSNQMIKKAGILNDVGEYQIALDCLDEYFENQFFVNDKYVLGLNLKLGILKALDKSTEEIENQIRTVRRFNDEFQ